MAAIMTTQAAAIYQFLSGFGIPAYADSSVPESATFPYLTYSLISGSWDDTQTLQVNLWYRTASEKEPNMKAEQIRRVIGLGGIVLECDGGLIWITRGSPWCQSMSDPADSLIKRRYILMDVNFLVTI